MLFKARAASLVNKGLEGAYPSITAPTKLSLEAYFKSITRVGINSLRSTKLSFS